MKKEVEKIVLIACCEYGYDIYSRLLSEKKIKINKIISLLPSQAKKYNVSGYFNYQKFAKKYNIEVYYPETYSLKAQKDFNFFKENNFDLMLMGGWQRLIPNNILETLKIGALGFHGSANPLPKGKGRSPINWSLIQGEKRFLLHLFLLDSGVDSGDVIDVLEFDILDYDDCRTLYYKVAICGRKLISKNIHSILKGSFKPIPQVGESSYYPKRKPEDGLINWNLNVFKIYNLIRGITRPYPGAFSYINGLKFTIWRAVPFDTKINYKTQNNGEVVEIFSKKSILIKCKDGLLLVNESEGPELRPGDILKST
jgi:methionyl-tRNA formyltransferase